MIDLDTITPEAVQDVLERQRRLRPLGDHALARLTVVGDRLRTIGVAPCRAGLEWSINDVLAACVDAHLARHRGAGTRRDGAAGTPAEALAVVSADFDYGRPELEAWSALHLRFWLCPTWQVQELAELIRPGDRYGDRHLRRRLSLGYTLLAQALRDTEIEALRRTA